MLASMSLSLDGLPALLAKEIESKFLTFQSESLTVKEFHTLRDALADDKSFG